MHRDKFKRALVGISIGLICSVGIVHATDTYSGVRIWDSGTCTVWS